MTLICQGFGENSQLSKTQVYAFFFWSREETEGEEGNGGQAQRLVHLMPQRCLARLPFVAESTGQRRKADTKNRQDSLQDMLCAITTHRQEDKAVGCLDTSLARSLQLSHGTGLTAALLLGLAHCYSEASATKKYAHTHTPCGIVEHLRPKDKYSAIKSTCSTEGSRPSLHKPFHGDMQRLLKLIFSDAVHNKSTSRLVEIGAKGCGSLSSSCFLKNLFTIFCPHRMKCRKNIEKRFYLMRLVFGWIQWEGHEEQSVRVNSTRAEERSFMWEAHTVEHRLCIQWNTQINSENSHLYGAIKVNSADKVLTICNISWWS